MSPVHDYVISNASGSSVRADLNNALAAIVSNNSNATSPATTYAYQWWADTTTGQLKLRNSANSAWITIFELDGTMLMEDGSLAAPGLAFASDLDTGFSRSAANKINFSTGGAERLEIGDSEVVFNDPSNDVDFRVESNGDANMLFVDAGNDRIGIGTSSPADKLHVVGDVRIVDNSPRLGFHDANAAAIGDVSGGIEIFDSSGNRGCFLGAVIASGVLSFGTNNTEQVRIDTSGRLLTGTTTARSNFYNSSLATRFQVEGTDFEGSSAALIRNSNNTNSSSLVLAKSRGTSTGSNTIVQNNDYLGEITFQGNDGSEFNSAASITCQVDGTPGANDMPARLVFSTTADSGSSPTERMRIDSSGRVGVGKTTLARQFDVDSTEFVVAKFSRPGGSGGFISLNDSATSSDDDVLVGAVGNDLVFHAGDAEAMRVDSSQRLLLGTTTEGEGSADNLTVADSGNCGITIRSGTGSVGSIYFSDATSGGGEYDGFIDYNQNSRYMRFGTASAEHIRLDSSGRLLVGTTSSFQMGRSGAIQVAGGTGAGANNAFISATRFGTTSGGGELTLGASYGSNGNHGLVPDGHQLGLIGFVGSDGSTGRYASVIKCLVDGSPGSSDMPGELVFSTNGGSANPTDRMTIKSSGEVQMTLAGGDVFRFGGGTNHSIFRDGKCGIHWTTNALLPTNGSGTINDNSMDIGEGSHRFDDIFATNGTIQTSDQTLKQDVAALTTAEIAVAKRIRGLVKTYRWIDAVEAKGDDARIHCGVIAQEIEQAFTDEGLDVNRYALFTSDTWYEANGVSLTKDGPVTADDEGAVEVTRRGVRYPELLAFVMAGVNAEMADVASRLAALEAA